MITQLSIVHFKAIASATIPLGPITVLVGPNDSGKSTILQALMALSRAGDPAGLSADRLLEGPPSVVASMGDPATQIEFAAEGEASLQSNDTKQPYRYELSVIPAAGVLGRERLKWGEEEVLTAVQGSQRFVAPNLISQGWDGRRTVLSSVAQEGSQGIGRRTIGLCDAAATDLGALLLRLDARAIARGSPLDAPLLANGTGVVGIVDEMLTSGVGDEQKARLNEALQRLSPHVQTVATKTHPPSGGKELRFVLRAGPVVPASQMSDGVVLATALVAIASAGRARRLLIEEPENGLHPRQLHVVAETIRSIAATLGTQIVMTTHSPLLLNHFTAEEVVLVTRTSRGVRAQRMSEARQLDELANEMSLGELWYNVGDSNLARPA